MEIKNLVKRKLAQYLSNEISRENLYKWSVDILHKMLKGDIFGLDYIEVLGFITGLAELDDPDNMYCDKIVRQLSNILLGAECATYTFAMRIPQEYVICNLSHMKKILMKYSSEKSLSKDGIRKLKKITRKEIKEPNTVNELLESQIIELLKLGYELSYEEKTIDFMPKSTVFINEAMEKSLEDSLLKKLIELIDCYEGESCFFIRIDFKNGDGNISIQV